MASHATHTRVWRNGTPEAQDFPLEQISDYLQQADTLVWADLRDPDPSLLARIADELSLDPHAVEDALDDRQRPKATRFSTHVFLTLWAIDPTSAAQDVVLGRVSAFITKQAVITVRLGDALDVADVQRRWDANADLLKFGSRALAYGLLDNVVDGYLSSLQKLEDATQAIEDSLFAEQDPASPDAVSRSNFRVRRAISTARRAVVPMRDLVGGIERRVLQNDDEAELRPYYEDLLDHVMQSIEWSESLHDRTNSIFSTSMSLSDTRMNEVMKKLTAWAAIIAVPTAITGFYGQNVPYPGYGHVWGFWVSVVLIVVIAAALYASFKKRDWF